jgi:hypothetical protein
MKLRIVLYCVFGGLAMTMAALGAGHFASWWIAGIVLAAAFVPVAMFGPRRFAGQLAVVLPPLFVISVLCTWSEALLFVATPGMKQNALRDLRGELFMYLIVGGVLATLAIMLKLGRDSECVPKLRAPSSIVLMVALAGVIYVVCYLVTGGITYQFFTKQYYPDAVKIVAPLGMWFWAIQFTRGVLMTIAVLPMIFTLRINRMNTTIAVGLLVWVAGGLALLIPPNPFMGSTQRFIHTIEILTQNFPLGVVAVLLMRPKAPASAAALMPAAQAHI